MRYALVTGGSRGIGRAISLKLITLGYHVLINYKSNAAEADLTLSMIKEAGGTGSTIKFDVSDAQDVESVLNKWQEENPEDYVEVLVNNAGIRQDALLMWMENSQWKEVLDTNLGGFFYVTRFS